METIMGAFAFFVIVWIFYQGWKLFAFVYELLYDICQYRKNCV